MEYVRADKAKAMAAGFSAATHNVKDGKMILTLKEVIFSPCLNGTAQERVAALDGETFGPHKIKRQ